MIDNPFTTNTFRDIWFKSFGKSESRLQFENLAGAEFYKNGFGIYVNSGKTHTKGMLYSLTDDINIKNNTLLIYDVPTFFKCPEHIPHKTLQVKKIKQYPGFLIELEGFDDLGDYLRKRFKKSSRYKLNKYKRRLDQCFDIQYKMYKGDVSEKRYLEIFGQFKQLLEKRFADKGEHNNNLDKQEWEFYKNVARPLIKENRAGLFVIEAQGTPIAITLVYFSKHIIFDAITVFDIDYSKFHLGSINIMYLIEWGIANKYRTLDFSKGYFDYKARWSTKQYDFEYHVLYNPRSIVSRTKAFFLTAFFKLKQYLRNQGMDKVANKVLFTVKKRDRIAHNTGIKPNNPPFEDYKLEDSMDLIEIDGHDSEIKKVLFDFLYLYNENFSDVNCFKHTKKQNQYIFIGKNTAKTILFPSYQN